MEEGGERGERAGGAGETGPADAADAAVSAEHAQVGGAEQVAKAWRADLAIGGHERENGLAVGVEERGAGSAGEGDAPQGREVARVAGGLVRAGLVGEGGEGGHEPRGGAGIDAGQVGEGLHGVTVIGDWGATATHRPHDRQRPAVLGGRAASFPGFARFVRETAPDGVAARF